MATLPTATIDAVPAESPDQSSDFPALDPITTFNLVGPTAANQQPNSLKQRDFTLRDRVNLLVANMNHISTGEGSAVLFLPRDGTNPMTGDLDMGGKQITGLGVLLPTATSTPDDYLQVSAGTYQKTDGKGYKSVGAQQVQITTPVGGGQTRYDLVHIDDTGALSVTQGVAGTPGTVPDFPDDELMIAIVKVDETGTIVVDTADITDARPFFAADQNARTLQTYPIDSAAPASGDALIWDGAKYVLETPGLATNAIGGLITSNNGSDALHDIDIAPGKARDDTDTASMVLSSTLTKQIDAVWAVGTNQGGLDAGSVAADTLYAIWLIKRSDTGVVDALFSTSFTAPTMPTNYDKKRLIAAVLTDGSADIVTYLQSGDYFRYMGDVIAEVGDATITNGAWETGTLSSVPPLCLAHIYGGVRNPTGTDTFLRLWVRTYGAGENTGNFDEAFIHMQADTAALDELSGLGTVLVDSTSQIEYAASEGSGTTTVNILVKGFTMLTRREP